MSLRRRQGKSDGGNGRASDEEEEGQGLCEVSVELEMKAPPPAYDDALYYGANEDPQSSTRLLDDAGGGDGAVLDGASLGSFEDPTEARQKQHNAYAERLLRQESNADDESNEEMEMLDIGSDCVLPESETVSLNAVDSNDGLSTVPAAAIDVEASTTVDDCSDAGIRRPDRRTSIAELRDFVEDTAAANGDRARYEADAEEGCFGVKKPSWFSVITGSPTRVAIVIFSILFCLGLILLVILLPMSFVYVEYYEYALSRSTWTGAVDYSTVYDSGCYLLAPNDELVRFKSTVHFMSQDIQVMDSTGLSIGISFTLQYFLKRDEVPQLYQKYLHKYDRVMKRLVESQVKNKAVSFTLEQYRLHRQEVETEIRLQVQKILSGDCCDSCCPDGCGRREVECGLCQQGDNCNPGHHIDVRYFQLGAIDVPEVVLNRYTQRIILEIQLEEEQYRQSRALELKKTQRNVTEIRNRASERIKTAQAEAGVIAAEAETNKLMDLEVARQKGLMKVFSLFNVTDEASKLSYIFARAMSQKQDDIIYLQGFESLTVSAP